MATNADGPRIGEIAQDLPIDGLDWSDVAPYWLVAEIDGVVVGALQLCLAKPFGWLEMLFIDEALDDLPRGRVTKAIVERGLLALLAFGAQAALGTVPHALPGYKRVLKRRGAVTLGSGNLMVKRL